MLVSFYNFGELEQKLRNADLVGPSPENSLCRLETLSVNGPPQGMDFRDWQIFQTPDEIEGLVVFVRSGQPAEPSGEDPDEKAICPYEQLEAAQVKVVSLEEGYRRLHKWSKEAQANLNKKDGQIQALQSALKHEVAVANQTFAFRQQQSEKIASLEAQLKKVTDMYLIAQDSCLEQHRARLSAKGELKRQEGYMASQIACVAERHEAQLSALSDKIKAMADKLCQASVGNRVLDQVLQESEAHNQQLSQMNLELSAKLQVALQQNPPESENDRAAATESLLRAEVASTRAELSRLAGNNTQLKQLFNERLEECRVLRKLAENNRLCTEMIFSEHARLNEELRVLKEKHQKLSDALKEFGCHWACS